LRVTRTPSCPDEVRRRREDPTVLPFPRGHKLPSICAMVRRGEGLGFRVTACPTVAARAREDNMESICEETPEEIALMEDTGHKG
jgi:hypothetical protein